MAPSLDASVLSKIKPDNKGEVQKLIGLLSAAGNGFYGQTLTLADIYYAGIAPTQQAALAMPIGNEPDDLQAQAERVADQIRQLTAGTFDVKPFEHFADPDFPHKPEGPGDIEVCIADEDLNEAVIDQDDDIYTPTAADYELLLCSRVAQLKSQPWGAYDVQECFESAQGYEISTGRSATAILDEINRVATQLHATLTKELEEQEQDDDDMADGDDDDESSPVPGEWTADFQGHEEVALRFPAMYDNLDFLGVALKSGLLSYVREKVSAAPALVRPTGKPREHTPLLMVAQIGENFYIEEEHASHSQAAILKFLFDAGADPNEPFAGLTPWYTLLSLNSAFDEVGAEFDADLQAYLDAGASAAQRFTTEPQSFEEDSGAYKLLRSVLDTMGDLSRIGEPHPVLGPVMADDGDDDEDEHRFLWPRWELSPLYMARRLYDQDDAGTQRFIAALESQGATEHARIVGVSESYVDWSNQHHYWPFREADLDKLNAAWMRLFPEGNVFHPPTDEEDEDDDDDDDDDEMEG